MYQLIEFNYKEGWMILLYKDGENTKYWCCDEDNIDTVWEYIELLKQCTEVETISPKLKTYDDVNSLNMDIFCLSKEDIEKLKSLE